MVESKTDALGIVAAEFPAGVKPVLTLSSRIATRNYAVDLAATAKAPRVDPTQLRYCLRPTTLLPTNGIVKTTADEITTRQAHTDVEKARAIYEWIVDNTSRNPKTRGCGIGDIRFMLEIERPQRQMRRSQRSVCRPRTRRRPSGARRLRHPRREIRSRLQKSRPRHRNHHKGAALPRRSPSLRLRLGSRRSR